METRSPTGAVALFVKTPGLSPIKTRLAETVGRKAAEEFYRLSVRAVEAVVREARLTPYWAVAEPEAESHPLWAGFDRIAQGPGKLGDRLGHVYDVLLSRHEFVLLLGADAPQIAPELIEQAAAKLLRRDAPNPAAFVLGPARDGGFYLFGGRTPIDREQWRQVPYSGADTAAQLARRLRPLGHIDELPPLTDADRLDDLPAVLGELQQCPRLLPEQQAVVAWIMERAFAPRAGYPDSAFS